MDLDDTASRAFLAGNFNNVQTTSRWGVAAVDTQNGAALSTGDAGIAGAVRSIEYFAGVDKIILGGDFSSVNGNTSYARYHALDSTNFGSDTALADVDDTVRAVWADGPMATNTFTGGDFSQLDGSAQANFAWNPDGTGADPSSPEANDSVYAIHHLPSANRVIVGGDFTNIAGSSRGRFALFDYDGTSMTLQSSPSFNGRIRSLTQNDSYIVAGGEFTTVDGNDSRRLTVLDAQSLDSVWPQGTTNNPFKADSAVSAGSTPEVHSRDSGAGMPQDENASSIR
jgi:hypothetical protein